MPTERLMCSVYKSSKKNGVFLYVDKRMGHKEVPEGLMEMFGDPVLVMEMLVTREKMYAKVDGATLIDTIQDKGYFLQMPDPEENLLAEHRKSLGLDPVVVNKNSG